MKRNVVLLVAVFLLSAACTTPKKDVVHQPAGDVTVRVLRVDPEEQNELGTRAKIFLRVQNETTKPVTVEEASIEVNFADDLDTAPQPAPAAEEESAGEPEPDGAGGDGDEVEVDVFEGSASSGEVVAAGMYYDLPVSINLTYPEEAQKYVAFCKLGIAHLDVEGQVKTSFGEIMVQDTGEIPTPTLPEPTAEQVQVATANNGEAGDIGMVLRIFNANVFNFKIRDWSYKVYVGDKMMREATVGMGERIQGNTAIQYDISVPLNHKTYGPEVQKLLQGDSIPYRVEGVLRFRDVTMPTVLEGKVNFSR